MITAIRAHKSDSKRESSIIKDKDNDGDQKPLPSVQPRKFMSNLRRSKLASKLALKSSSESVMTMKQTKEEIVKNMKVTTSVIDSKKSRKIKSLLKREKAR
jgi:hypothetical protein